MRSDGYVSRGGGEILTISPVRESEDVISEDSGAIMTPPMNIATAAQPRKIERISRLQ
jgi:hypothetical protein